MSGVRSTLSIVALVTALGVSSVHGRPANQIDFKLVPAHSRAGIPSLLNAAVASNSLQVNAPCGDARSLTLPVRDANSSDGLTWGVPFNYFANYYSVMGGHHPGEDWNLVGGSPSADLNEPVYAIGSGVVEKVSNLNALGHMVVVRHTGSFAIPGRSGTENGQAYSYPTERVSSIYSVYLHLTGVPSFVEGSSCVDANSIVGRIMNPGGGPHLHFEIRHPLQQHSEPTWSLVYPTWNWAGGSNPTGYYLDVQRMVTCNSASDCSGMRHPRDVINANSADTSPQDKSLIRPDNSSTVYWVQNNKRYGIPSMQVIFSMRGMPGWDDSRITALPASTVTSIPEGPTFITHNSDSNGLLIREQGSSAVYLIENGRRRLIRNEEALQWMGVEHRPNVIEVTYAVMAGYPLPNDGRDVYALGESETNVVKNVFIDAYGRNASDTYCRSSSTWKGWPGSFSECLHFPIGMVGVAYQSSVSGAVGKFQEFGNESRVYGSIQYNSTTGKAYAVWGAILSRWRELGYGQSRLGFPTSDEYQSGLVNRRTDFEGGYISWNQSTDSTTVVYGFSPPPTSTPNISGDWVTTTSIDRKTAACGTDYFPYIPQTSAGRLNVTQNDTSIVFRDTSSGSQDVQLTGTINGDGTFAVSTRLAAGQVQVLFELNGRVGSTLRTLSADVKLSVIGTGCSASGTLVGNKV